MEPTLMAGEEGLMGVAGRPWAVYHANTEEGIVSSKLQELEMNACIQES